MMKIAARSSTGAFHHEKEGRAMAGALEREASHRRRNPAKSRVTREVG